MYGCVIYDQLAEKQTCYLNNFTLEEKMQQNRDEDHLTILAIMHYVISVLFGMGALFPLIYLVIGVVILNGGFETNGREAPPPAVGWILIGFSAFAITIGLTIASCIALAGRKLQTRRNHLFCLIVAGVECLFMPLGTALGIFTIVVLLRPSVKELFGVGTSAPGTPPIYER